MNTRLYMTPAELAVQDRIDAEIKAGNDPFGDANEDELDAETVEVIAADQVARTAPAAELETPEAIAAREAAEATAATEAADKLAAEQAATAAAAPPAAPAPPPAAEIPVGKDGAPVDLADLEHLRLAPLPVVDETAYLKTRDELQAQIDAIDGQWEDGTITREQRVAQARPLQHQLDAASRQHAADVGEYNATGRMNQQQTQVVLDRIRGAALRDGLDYSDAAKSTQYDMATQAIARDPKNANLSWVKVCALADASVRAMNGIVVKAPSAAPAPPAAAPTVAATPTAAAPAPKPAPVRTPPTPPTTLRDLPVAARAAEQGATVSARIAQADANQRDAIYRALTPAQRAALLDD